MLKQHWKVFSQLERIGDNLVIVGAFFFTYYLRDVILSEERRLFGTLPKAFGDLGPISDYFVVLALAIPLFAAILQVLGAYRSMRFRSYPELFRISVFAGLLVFLCQGAILYAIKMDLSRSFVAIFCVTCSAAIFCERILVLYILRYYRKQGKNFRNIAIVGPGDQAKNIYQEIIKRPELGIYVKGFITTENERQYRLEINGDSDDLVSSVEFYDLPARVIATPETFERALKRYAIDEVLFADVSGYFNAIKEMAEIAMEEGVQVSVAADLFSLEIVKSDISYFGNVPLIHYEPSPADAFPLFVKRFFDVVLSTIAIIVLSPIMIAAAVAIKIDGPGPVLFRQRRVGQNGRIFTLFKFRSMVQKAHSMLPQLMQYNEMSGPVFKMTNDPRVTKVGHFIRKYSIDELPQLINVWRGDMSLVGPRPPIPSEVSKYRRKQRRRLSMRPGLTCTWQVSGRNKIVDFEEWAKMDLDYIDNWNFWKDLILIIKTIPVVLSGFGAK